jgi:hypothetical protein
MRPDVARCVFPTKLVIVLHDLAHQVLYQVLADRAVLATGQFSHRLRDRDNHFVGLTRSSPFAIIPCPLPDRQSYSRTLNEQA